MSAQKIAVLRGHARYARKQKLSVEQRAKVWSRKQRLWGTANVINLLLMLEAGPGLLPQGSGVLHLTVSVTKSPPGFRDYGCERHGRVANHAIN